PMKRVAEFGSARSMLSATEPSPRCTAMVPEVPSCGGWSKVMDNGMSMHTPAAPLSGPRAVTASDGTTRASSGGTNGREGRGRSGRVRRYGRDDFRRRPCIGAAPCWREQVAMAGSPGDSVGFLLAYEVDTVLPAGASAFLPPGKPDGLSKPASARLVGRSAA